MPEGTKSPLYNRQASVEFYEKRFARGYVEEWPLEKKRRIAELIRGLQLPDRGEALDFGCGNGVLTDVLRTALPAGWKTHGTDLSANAVMNAREWYPDCRFFSAGDAEMAGNKFDLLFTHHVLEHVFDLPKTLAEMDAWLKPQAGIVHVLPCGNAGSLEHTLCLQRSDGINHEMEGRFFFEEDGHVRRLSTDQMQAHLGALGFKLVNESYGNHDHGAIDWITRSRPSLVWGIADPSKAGSADARNFLRRLRRRLLLLWLLRVAAPLVEGRMRRRKRSLVDWGLILLGLPFYPLAKPMDLYLKHLAREEWEQSRAERNGSEMYLYFRRS